MHLLDALLNLLHPAVAVLHCPRTSTAIRGKVAQRYTPLWHIPALCLSISDPMFSRFFNYAADSRLIDIAAITGHGFDMQALPHLVVIGDRWHRGEQPKKNCSLHTQTPIPNC